MAAKKTNIAKSNTDNFFIMSIDKKKKIVHGKCGCGCIEYVKFYDSYQPIDYYNKIIDKLKKP